MGKENQIKGFIVDDKHLILAKDMKDTLKLALEKDLVSDEGIHILPMPETMKDETFYHKIGDLNDIQAIQSLFTFYKDETISLKYNGEYLLSEEKVSRFIRSKENDEPILLCSKATQVHEGLEKQVWMKVDGDNHVISEQDKRGVYVDKGKEAKQLFDEVREKEIDAAAPLFNSYEEINEGDTFIQEDDEVLKEHHTLDDMMMDLSYGLETLDDIPTLQEEKKYNVFPNQANPIPYDTGEEDNDQKEKSQQKSKKPWEMLQ